IMPLNIPFVEGIIADYQHGPNSTAGFCRWRTAFCAPPEGTGPAVTVAQQIQTGAVDVLHHRTAQTHGIILLGFFTKTAELICTIIDAADEGDFTVHHHQFAMQPTEDIHP